MVKRSKAVHKRLKTAIAFLVNLLTLDELTARPHVRRYIYIPRISD
jgi:hypothetical protein